MSSSTLVQAMVVNVIDIQFKGASGASKLVGILERVNMKLKSKLLSPLVIDTQLLKSHKCVQNIDHTTNTQKDLV